MKTFDEVLTNTTNRIKEDAAEVAGAHRSARQVLDSLVGELAPAVIAYKTQGAVPSIQVLQSAASKLTAIIAATKFAYEAQGAPK